MTGRIVDIELYGLFLYLLHINFILIWKLLWLPISQADLISAATKVSPLFCRFPPDLLRKLSTDCIVMQNHHVSL